MQNPFKGPWVSLRAVFKEQVLQQELYAELVISLLREQRCVQTAFFQRVVFFYQLMHAENSRGAGLVKMKLV